MSHIINVSVKNHVAKQTDKTVYVCGNDDFVINFDFDSEWDQYDTKTARFTYAGTYVDVVFTGNTCAVPVITDVWRFKVGVFAGDLSTTTPVLISASKSILCDAGAPAAPTDDVYNQIMDVVNEATTASNEAKASAEAVTPDDTAIDGKPWTSKHIVDELCPEISETGNPVQCYPLKGYPLTATASWEPTQSGSGDPSPDNIRPITGRNSVQIQRCGENLFDETQATVWTTSLTFGLTITYDGNTVTISGTPTETLRVAQFRILRTTQKPQIKFKPFGTGTLPVYVFQQDNSIVVRTSLTKDVAYNSSFKIMGYVGTTEPTAYVPYTGTTTTLTLPETIYGGSVSNDGAGKKEWYSYSFSGAEDFGGETYDFYLSYNKLQQNGIAGKIVSNQYGNGTITSTSSYKINSTSTHVLISKDGRSVTEFKSFLAAQYAAGNPVQICYKLATPTTFTATGGAELTGLDGLNNVLTDADSVTVEGREDIKHTIQELQDALASATEG